MAPAALSYSMVGCALLAGLLLAPPAALAAGDADAAKTPDAEVSDSGWAYAPAVDPLGVAPLDRPRVPIRHLVPGKDLDTLVVPPLPKAKQSKAVKPKAQKPSTKKPSTQKPKPGTRRPPTGSDAPGKLDWRPRGGGVGGRSASPTPRQPRSPSGGNQAGSQAGRDRPGQSPASEGPGRRELADAFDLPDGLGSARPTQPPATGPAPGRPPAWALAPSDAAPQETSPP
ncbi:MAG: hypothetical protein AAF790_15280, partial [Planctomycetota bacterium]